MQQRLIDYMCRYIYFACCCLSFVCLPLSIVGSGEEEKSIAIQIPVCRASGLSCWTFHGDGLFSCRVYVNRLTPVCQFHPFAASLCCLLVLAGVQ